MWTTMRMVEHAALPEDDLAEAIGALLDTFHSTTVEDFDVEAFEQYQRRKADVGKILKDNALTDEAFSALLGQGSTAGIFRRAVEAANAWPTLEDADPAAGLAVLEAYSDYIASDQRCQQLALNLSWLQWARAPLFTSGGRRTLPLTSVEWQDCLDRIGEIEALGESPNRGALLFQRALAEFHLGRVSEAIRVFESLRREQLFAGRRRLTIWYYASTTAGRAIVYTGQYRPRREQAGRPRLYVNELQTTVEFNPRDFAVDPDAYATLEFVLGFSTTGMQAAPVSRAKHGRDENGR